ncbi:SirB1 family protein [Alienimonas sp. DA493]|uniref:SirB1 family protein n=1 Tax=Alienimonas sp. DA493 TaxID=3373605 RepID=UPI0037546C91
MSESPTAGHAPATGSQDERPLTEEGLLIDEGTEERPAKAEPDGEFWKLACRRRDVNLTAVALEIARDHDPACDPADTLRWLKARATEARGPVAAAADGRAALTALADVLCGDHEMCGGEAAFDDPAGSLIHQVIETGTGLPIALSLIYMDVARRVGLELVGVNAPHHFLTRLDTAAGPLFCDPYHGGRVMNADEAVEFLMDRCDLAPAEIADSLHPAPPRAIVVRVLNNLKAIHARRGDWPAAWTVQTRLSALCPADYTERRDLALIALHAGRAGQAVDLLTALLPDAPTAEKPVLKRHLHRAVAQVSKWN